MKMKVFALLAAVVLTYAWWLLAGLLFGNPSDRGIAYTTIGWTLAAIVVLAAKRMSHAAWIAAGFVLLATLCLPDSTFFEIARTLPQPLADPLTFLYLLLLPMALVVGALLLHSAFKLYYQWELVPATEGGSTAAKRKQMVRVIAVCLGLCALLIAKALHSFYWFMVWDTTNDPLGNLLLPFPILIVLSCSTVLDILLPGRTRVAGPLYLLLIPALIALSSSAQNVEFRALTRDRAGQVSQAIDAYYAREGRYPQDLQQLSPFYILSLPTPVIMFGQGWCYQAGQDYYRFGYLDREHWSSPIVFGRVTSFQGRSPLKVDVCQSVVDIYRTQHPDWGRALQQFGLPTPTPDIRE